MDAFDAVAAAGCKVNNLFEREDGQWQANLRSFDGHTDYAIAATPAEALMSCLTKRENAVSPDCILRLANAIDELIEALK